VFQGVPGWCSVLQGGAVCCRVLQGVAESCGNKGLSKNPVPPSVYPSNTTVVCCGVLRCVAVSCSVLQCVAVIK